MEDLSGLKKLLTLLLPKLMAGGATEYGQTGTMYMKQLCRLIDKAIYEYEMTREQFNKDALDTQTLYMFGIMNHLENSVNATQRALRYLARIKADKNCLSVPRLQTRLIEAESDEIINFRNSIEHFDERIQAEKGPILLVVDSAGNKATLGESELNIAGQSRILKKLHTLVMGLIT